MLLFLSEPLDKILDQVSDAVLNVCLTLDPKCKVACETCVKHNMAVAAREITVVGKIDCETVVRGAVKNIGFNPFFDVVSSVDSKGLHYQDCEVLVRINKPSPDFAGGVHVDKDDFDVDVGGQGIMFREEAEDATLPTHSMATRGKNLTDARKNGDLWWLRLDGKTEVTIECFDSSPNLATKHIIYEMCWATVVFCFVSSIHVGEFCINLCSCTVFLRSLSLTRMVGCRDSQVEQLS